MMNHKYAELVSKLRKDIQTGFYSDGERLPGENAIAEENGCSRQTVRQAIGILENEGLLNRVQGSGTYVRTTSAHREKYDNVAVVTTYISEYIFPDILFGITQTLSYYGYTPLLYATGNRVDNERRILTELLKKQIDGIIVEGTKTALPNPNIDLYEKLSEMGIPVVFINGFYPALKRAVYVVADDKAGGRMACEMLIKNGRSKIAGVFKSDDMQGHYRYAGYCEALRDEGLAVEDDRILWYTTETRDNRFSTYAADMLKDCDSVVCYNDEAALGILKAMQENGIPPIELVSFDNSTYAQMSAVKFVSLSNPKCEIGRKAAKKIVNILGGRAEQSVVLPWNIK